MAHPDRALLGRSRGGRRRARRRNFACPSFRLKERCKLAGIGTGTHETEPITENLKVTGDSMKCRNLLVVFLDRKSTRLNSSHGYISYAVFCLKKKKNKNKAS